MSIDKSLKSHKVLQRHRSVLTRAERIERLEEEERWSEDQGVLALPKVRNLCATCKSSVRAAGARNRLLRPPPPRPLRKAPDAPRPPRPRPTDAIRFGSAQ